MENSGTVYINVEKDFRDWNLRLNINSSSHRLVIWGPSGAGKSLTLRMIAGLMAPDKGKITVCGRCLFDSSKGINLPPQKRRVGIVFQDYALFPHLTVAENLAFAIRNGRVRSRHVHAMAERLEITSLLKVYPAQLSGGQRQRVAIGRTLLAEPDLLLLDEPFSALDAGLRRRLRQEFVHLTNDLSLPIVLVTHDPEDVRAIGEEVAVIHHGSCTGCLSIPSHLLLSGRQTEDPLWRYLENEVPGRDEAAEAERYPDECPIREQGASMVNVSVAPLPQAGAGRTS